MPVTDIDKETPPNPKLNTLAAIVRDDLAVVHATFGVDADRAYTYLAPLALAEQLERGDLIVVESSSRKCGYSTAVVRHWEPDVNLNPDDGILYLWAFQKVDLSLLHDQKKVQNALIDKLENRRQRSVREQALAALGISDPKLFLEDIKAK